MITSLVKAADGTLIASAQSADDARLCIDRVYEDGDTVEILADEKHLCVQMDGTLLPGEVYLPNGRMTWRVPAGDIGWRMRPARSRRNGMSLRRAQ